MWLNIRNGVLNLSTVEAILVRGTSVVALLGSGKELTIGTYESAEEAKRVLEDYCQVVHPVDPTGRPPINF